MFLSIWSQVKLLLVVSKMARITVRNARVALKLYFPRFVYLLDNLRVHAIFII
jgi:hypothetical protein